MARTPKGVSPQAKRRFVLACLVLLIGGSTVGGYYLFQPDPLDRCRKLGQELRSEATRNLDREERAKLYERYRTEFNKLTPAQQQTLRMESEKRRERYMQDRINELFAKPPEERIAAIDAQIQRWEQMRAEAQHRAAQRAAERAANPEAAGQGGGRRERGPRPEGGRGPEGGGGPPAGENASNRGGPPGTRGKMSDDERLKYRKERLTWTTAEERAQRNMYRALMQQRREAMGLPPSGRGGFGGPGFGPPGGFGGRGGFGGGSPR
jgi:hypothetical protein